MDFPSEPPEETSPEDMLILDFQSLELRPHIPFILSPVFMVICCSWSQGTDTRPGSSFDLSLLAVVSLSPPSFTSSPTPGKSGKKAQVLPALTPVGPLNHPWELLLCLTLTGQSPSLALSGHFGPTTEPPYSPQKASSLRE